MKQEAHKKNPINHPFFLRTVFTTYKKLDDIRDTRNNNNLSRVLANRATFKFDQHSIHTSMKNGHQRLIFLKKTSLINYSCSFHYIYIIKHLMFMLLYNAINKKYT